MTPQATAGRTILGALADLGSRAMIDFGLAGLLDRIERDFGPRWAKALVAVMGLTIVVVCLSLIGSTISSLYGTLVGAVSQGGWGRMLWYLAQLLVGVLILAFFANNVVTAFEIRRSLTRVRDADAKSAEHLASLEELQARYGRQIEEMEALAAAVLEKATAVTGPGTTTVPPPGPSDEAAGVASITGRTLPDGS